MKIAIQGEPGSFSHEAARRMVKGLAGSVTEHLDLLLARDVFIQRDFRLRIVHNLIAAPGVKKADLRRVFSHPVALDQCRDFFRANPKIQPTPFYDTAGSVKHVIENKKQMRDAAGIASRHTASVYKGHILAAGIEDDKRNFTRFVLLRHRRRVLPGANKTSIAFGLKNVPGALHKALRVFADRDISLSKIESRPIRGRPWEYVFYADFLRGDDKLAKGALLQLKAVADMVKVLGVYPAA
jgi:prephenate dehydratase